MSLEVPESNSGVVNNGEGSVVINVAALPQDIPESLRNWRELQPGENPDDLPKKRTLDFLFPQPGVREWAYHIVPPAGYVAKTLPQSETKKIGTTSFAQEIRQGPNDAVVATFRFDTGKRRITPAEFEETRVALTKFLTDNTVTINFELVGQSKLNAGDVRGALDEFRRLTLLHPKEAQHHIETARALLTGGLGDAAREEIRRAIAIEPKNARAHQMLGHVLLHDSLGRLYRKGFDQNGAIAAFRKAKELAPDDYAIRVALASALTYGTDGLRFSHGARLAEAAEEIQALAKDLGDQGKPMLPELTLIYSHMGRFADVRALAPTLEDTQQRDLARIIATAAIDGTDAALRELDAFDQQRKRSYASGVAQMMMQVRLYPQAAALMDVASQGTAAAAEQRPLIEILKKLKRAEEIPQDDGPRGVIAKFWSKLLHSDIAGMKELLPPEYAKGEKNPLSEMATMDLRPPDGLPLLVFGDLMSSMLEVQQDGDDQTGYRLRMRMLGTPAATEDMFLFVRRENGRWLIRGASRGEELTGDTVLSMVAKGELEAGRKWLNWVREDAKGGTSDDPLEGIPFAALWPKSKATADAEEIRVAAASLATDPFVSARSEPILIAARDTAKTDAAKAAIDLALVTIYQERKEWPKMLPVTSRLFASHSDSPTAFSTHITALLRNGKAPEATALANQRLERLPNDRDAVRALALSAAEAGDYKAAQQYAVKVADELRPKHEDFALAAWVALFTDQQLDRAIEHAQHASKDTEDEKEEDVQSLHVLAALYAATGKSIEARTALLKSIDEDHRGTLRSDDWYILGRIAENYGVEDFAIAAYRKVEKDQSVASVSELAQRRLAGLAKKKP
jgi:tetratricopeptide (TPR) repeat protein